MAKAFKWKSLSTAMYFYPVALHIRHNSVDKTLNRYLYTVQPSLRSFFLGGPSIQSLLLQPLYNGHLSTMVTSLQWQLSSVVNISTSRWSTQCNYSCDYWVFSSMLHFQFTDQKMAASENETEILKALSPGKKLYKVEFLIWCLPLN